jgi:predicted metal-dependent enzyme (double-stranded beta helix superfamily)
MITDVRPDTRRFYSERIAGARYLGSDRLLSLASSLVPTLTDRGFEAKPDERCWDLLASSSHFEAWAIGWPPGGAIELHDHGNSAGALVVVSGDLVETKIVEEDGALKTRSTALGAGSTLKLAKKCVHDVVNIGSTPAVSVHVYAPRLQSMTYYELVDGTLDPVRTVRY